MAGIETYLEQINNAIYGRDVRQAIHDAIHQCYEDGKAGAVDLEARERISNLAQLQEGSTTGDAELIDGRTVDGKTYDNIGDAIRATRHIVDSFAFDANDANNGTVIEKKFIRNNVETVGNDYFSIKQIPVISGETYYLDQEVYEENTYGARFINYYTVGGDFVETIEYPSKALTIPSDVASVSISYRYKVSASGSTAGVKGWYYFSRSDSITEGWLVKMENINGIDSYLQMLDSLYTGKSIQKSLTMTQNKYISSSTGELVTGAYAYSQPIRVSSGMKVAFEASGSASVFVLAMYENESDTTADLNKSITGRAANEVRFAVIPEGINYVRVCYNKTGNVSLAIISESVTEMAERINVLEQGGDVQTIRKRKASVSFIFDDGNANDSLIKDIFDNHSKKCGFAVFAPIASRYVDYYSDGYEILAHASSPVSDPTEASERQQMSTAYNNVVAAVGVCHGWVTPSSTLADEFKPLVYDYYEYGYTVYKGSESTPENACMNKNMTTYSLWRSSLQTLTLEQQKAIVDYAVANNLLICFYGHAADLDTTDNLTTENLNALLSYCDSVGINVETPYISTRNYMAFRHNEDYAEMI